MNRYRVMVQGEDGTLFCTKNNIRVEDVEGEFDRAVDDYPCGSVFVEEECL